MKESGKKHYRHALAELYPELVNLQRWIIARGKRVVCAAYK